MFFLSSLVTGPSFLSISSLVLELWQFSFISNWQEIRKLEVSPHEFWLISGDWGKLKIPNLAWMFLMKCYWMLQNTRAITFIVSELLKENQQGRGWGGGLDPPTQITKVANYEEARVKLTNAQLNKLKSVGKKKTGTTIRITKKTFKMKNYLMNYL